MDNGKSRAGEAPATVAAPPVLEVQELAVRFGGVLAVDGVSLSTAGGEILGLIGPNGAGKTTFIDCVTGFVRAAEGRIFLSGKRIDGLAPHRRSRLGLVRTFQSLELFEDLTVGENLLAAAERPEFLPTVSGMAARRRSRALAVDQALAWVGLSDRRQRRPGTLSLGERKLVGLARALAAGPRILLLDEPAAGLGPAETHLLARLLRSLADGGLGVLLVDHDMSMVLGCCDRVQVLDVGCTIAIGTPESIRGNPKVLEAYLGAPSTTRPEAPE